MNSLVPSLSRHPDPNPQRQSFQIVSFRSCNYHEYCRSCHFTSIDWLIILRQKPKKQLDMKGENSAHCYPLSYPILDNSYIIIFRSSIILLQDKINTKDPQWGNYTNAKCRAHWDFSEWTDRWDPLRWTAFQTPWVHLIITSQHPHQGNHSYKLYCNQYVLPTLELS